MRTHIFLLWILLIAPISSLTAVSHLPFDASMSVVPYYLPPEMTHNKDWKLLKQLYEDYHHQSRLAKEYTIPKLIHLIWLGSPLPERCKLMVSSWQKYHPDWTIKVWNDEDAASFQFTNQAAFDKARNWGEKSDIWRYEILFRYGGLYVDTDFECLQPFDDLHRSCEFYTGIGQSTDPVLLIGIIGSRPEHPILKAIIENVCMGPGDNDFERIMQYTGPYLFTRVFLAQARFCDRGTVLPLPTTFFYPFPGSQRHRKDQEKIKQEFVRPESMAVHYFATSWQ